jgi:hypothetical protein
MSVTQINFSSFDLFDFSLVTIERKDQLCYQMNHLYPKISGKQILVISNLKDGLFPIFFKKGDAYAYLTSGQDILKDGSCLSIGSKIKLNQILFSDLSQLDIKIGKISSFVFREPLPFEMNEICYNIVASFSEHGEKKTVLVDSRKGLNLNKKLSAFVMNIRPECIFDVPIFPLCYQTETRENIPFTLEGKNIFDLESATLTKNVFDLTFLGSL